MSTTRRVYKIDDATLVKLFSDITERFSQYKLTSHLTLLRGHTFDLDEVQSMDNLAGNYSFHDARINVEFGPQRKAVVVFRRSIKRPNSQEEPSARYDEFDLIFDGGDQKFWQDNRDLVVDLVGLVASVSPQAPLSDATGEETTLQELMRGMNATHRQMLSNLDKSLKKNIERRDELEREADEREAARQVSYKKEMEELAAERDKLRLQSYRSERRRIMQEITNAEALNRRRDMLPKGATLARWAVFCAAILLGLIAFGITYHSLAQLGADEALAQSIIDRIPESASTEMVSQTVKDALGTTNWYLIIRSVFSSLIGIGSFAYAASWLKSFYDGEIAAARALDQFNHDLVRASWVIETVLEVKEEHDSVVPNRWIEGVTRGLFSESGPQSSSDESVQALKALLGFTASASFGPEGPKVELNRKEARKLSGG